MASSLFNQLNNQQQTNYTQKATVQSVLQEVKQSGMTAQELFLTKARNMGIDPNSILSKIPPQFR